MGAAAVDADSGREVGTGSDPRVVPHRDVLEPDAGSDARSRAQYRVQDDCTGTYRRAGHEHAAVDAGVLSHAGVPQHHRAAGDLGARCDQRAGVHASRCARLLRRHCGARRRTQHEVAGGGDQRRRGADIAPVGVLDVSHDQGVVLDQARKGLPLDGHDLARWDQVDHPPTKDVAAGVHLVCNRMLGLLGELGDPPVGVGRHAPERAGVIDLHEVQRHVDGPSLAERLEVLELGGELVPRNHVAVENHHCAVRVAPEDAGHVADGSRRAEWLALHHVVHPHIPPAAVSEHWLEQLSPVGGGDDDVSHASVGQPADLVLEERNASDLQQVLRPVRRQRKQTGAEAARDDHCLRRRLGARVLRASDRHRQHALIPYSAGMTTTPPTRATFPATLERVLRGDATRPLVTFYDDASGERVELSVATYANWVAKTAGLTQDELDVEAGGLVLLDLPTHWLGAVWLGAAWTLGLAGTDDRSLVDQADLVVCGPDGVGSYAAHADRVPVLALSLRPLGGRFEEALPTGVTDYGAVVLAQPDLFVPAVPPAGADPAWRDGSGTSTQADLLAAAAGSSAVGPEGRLLTDVNPCSRPGLATLLAPVVRRASTVWVRPPSEQAWAARREQERATAELRDRG